MTKAPQTKMFSFRLYVDEMEKLKRIAKKRRTTVSELMRVALRKIIDGRR